MFSLICAWINGWVNNREAGDLRRHRTHYDVTIMSPQKYIIITILLRKRKNSNEHILLTTHSNTLACWLQLNTVGNNMSWIVQNLLLKGIRKCDHLTIVFTVRVWKLTPQHRMTCQLTVDQYSITDDGESKYHQQHYKTTSEESHLFTAWGLIRRLTSLLAHWDRMKWPTFCLKTHQGKITWPI